MGLEDARVDFLYHSILARIILEHSLARLPARRGGLPLYRRVNLAVLWVRLQPVPEHGVPYRLGRVGPKDVEVGVGLEQPKEAVLVPLRLAVKELEVGLLQRGHVGRLVCRVRNHQVDVDDRLSR